MSLDARIFLLINGLAGKVPAIDWFFQGIADDYFALILSCFILVALWFGIRDAQRRQRTQKAIITAAIAIAIVNILVVISTAYYFRVRPFNALPPESVHLLFPKPHDSSFPSNFASVMFAIAVSMFTGNRKWGTVLLILAAISSFGRIYVGIHYPGDILGGVGFGLAAATLAYITARLLRRPLDYFLGLLRRLFLA